MIFQHFAQPFTDDPRGGFAGAVCRRAGTGGHGGLYAPGGRADGLLGGAG